MKLIMKLFLKCYLTMMNAVLILIFPFKFINSCLLYLVNKKQRTVYRFGLNWDQRLQMLSLCTYIRLIFLDQRIMEQAHKLCCYYVNTSFRRFQCVLLTLNTNLVRKSICVISNCKENDTIIPQKYAYNMNSNRLLNKTLPQSHNHNHDLQNYYHLQ